MRLIISDPDTAYTRRQRMQREAPELPFAEPQVLSHRTEISRDAEHQHDGERRGNRRALEVRHLAGAGRHLLRHHVITCKPRHAARDEIREDHAVIQAAYAASIADDRRRHAERNDIGERIQLLAQ